MIHPLHGSAIPSSWRHLHAHHLFFSDLLSLACFRVGVLDVFGVNVGGESAADRWTHLSLPDRTAAVSGVQRDADGNRQTSSPR